MKGLIAGTCLFFLMFAAARDVYVPLTYDEAASYIRYIDTNAPSVFDPGWLTIFNFEVATNHFLNTALTKVVNVVAGGSEFALRLPNLLGYAMYLTFSLLLLRRFVTSRMAASAGFLLLNLNPYVLDFFTLSRGYGLSLGFLMGALFFLFTYLELLRRGRPSARALSRSLFFAGGAVLANFALLNVYLAIVLIVLCALIVAGRRAPRELPASSDRQDARARVPPVLWPLLAAGLFSALVLSQDAGLSSALYEPVSVKPLGLEPAALDRLRVYRIDLRGRETALRRDPETAMWRTGGAVRGLKLELPADDAARLARIEVVIGAHPFSSDPNRRDAWTMRDLGNRRIFESASALSLPRSKVGNVRAIINWAGDRIYVRELAAATAVALSVFAAFAVGLCGLTALVIRGRLLAAEELHRLCRGVLWLAAFVGVPLYLLRRDGQLYYGGVQGLIADTFNSLIENSFYGRSYLTHQRELALAAVLATLAAFPIVLYIRSRRRRAADMLPLAGTLAILLFVSGAVIVQRLLFGTVFLLGRTALFYIPLYVVFFALLCDAIHGCGRAGRAFATAMVAVALSCSVWHFASTANLTHTWDWPEDASTKLMMGDLTRAVVAGRGPGAHVVLAVDWTFTPVAVYYARRTSAADIDVVGLPARFGADYFYLEEKNGGASQHVIGRYRRAGSILVGRP